MLTDIHYRCLQGGLDREIAGIVYDSRKAGRNDLFICIRGTDDDGHKYAEEAAKRGVAAVICEEELPLPQQVTVIQTEDSRTAMAKAATAFYRNPAESLRMIGITGTKGKTTTAFMIQSILNQGGYRCGLIGTVHIDTGNRIVESERTTPEAPELQKYLREMADCGCKAAVIEVSSQALMLGRTEGICFDYGVFTNLEEDHIGLGEHRDLEHYAACKARLFQNCKVGVMNGDDPHKEWILREHTCLVETYGFGFGNDLRGERPDYVRIPGKLGVEFQIRGDYNINLVVGMTGTFSCYNAMAAIGVCRHFLIPRRIISRALREISVPGRQQMFSAGEDRLILVDYAHNGMALKNLLSALRQYHPKKLTCIFGCGGQRDRNRRFQMAEAALAYSDFTVITQDNSRGEPAGRIIGDIAAPFLEAEKNFAVIPDRGQAIEYGVNHCQKGEILVVAGKGHENYQITGNTKIHFDDREEVLRSIEKENHESNYIKRN